MEREVKYGVVFETTRLSDATNLYGFINSSPLAEKYKQEVVKSEIIQEVIVYGGIKDFEEYEFARKLNKGTFSTILVSLISDLEAKGKDSPVANVRFNENSLIALEDLGELARDMIDGNVRIRGIGMKRANLLLESTAFLAAYSSASESFD